MSVVCNFSNIRKISQFSPGFIQIHASSILYMNSLTLAGVWLQMGDIAYDQCEECTSYEHVTDDCPLFDRCSNCFERDHETKACLLPPQVRCANCLRANTSTETCDCQQNMMFKQMQGLRLVGNEQTPSPLLDLTIYAEKYVALVGPFSRRTFVSEKIVDDYNRCPNVAHIGLYNDQEERVAVELHITIESRMVLQPCFILKHRMAYDVILGMDFLQKYGWSMRIGKFTINKYSPIFTTDDEVQYWRKVTVANGPQIQKANARIIKLNKNRPTRNVLTGLARKLGADVGDEEDVDEGVLSLHPSPKEVKLFN